MILGVFHQETNDTTSHAASTATAMIIATRLTPMVTIHTYWVSCPATYNTHRENILGIHHVSRSYTFPIREKAP